MQNSHIKVGAEFESDYNGNTYTIENVSVEGVKISSTQTGANWFSEEKIAEDIESGVLIPQ